MLSRTWTNTNTDFPRIIGYERTRTLFFWTSKPNERVPFKLLNTANTNEHEHLCIFIPTLNSSLKHFLAPNMRHIICRKLLKMGSFRIIVLSRWLSIMDSNGYFIRSRSTFLWSGTDWKFLVHGVRAIPMNEWEFFIWRSIIFGSYCKRSPTNPLMTLSDLFSMTKMNRSESFGIIPNIYEKFVITKSGDYGIISGDVISWTDCFSINMITI